MRRTLTTLVVGAALALAGGVAHAADTPVQSGPPTIFMLDTLRDTQNGTHAVHTDCVDGKPVIHTALYNDHGGPDETVQVYLEPTGPWNTLGEPVLNQQPAPAPIDIPAGGSTPITLPYENGHAVFVAVAVAKGGTLPTTVQELEADMSKANGHVPTADSSQLFFPGGGTNGKYEYAVAPAACTPPPQTACPPNWPINPFPAEEDACIPHPTATVTVTVTRTVPGPTMTKTVTSTVTATAPGSTTTVTQTVGAPFPGAESTDSRSASTTPVATGMKLAHTGASVVPLAVAAVILVGFGGGALALSRKLRRR